MGKKILLADDSITIQKVIELTFSDEDFEVVTVGNGRLAIEKAQEVRPDIVLCDIIMPEKDGYEVCAFIKGDPNLAATPVLLLTGAFEPFDQERAAQVRANGSLAKPFEPQTLVAKVKELLARAPSSPAAPPPAAATTLPVSDLAAAAAAAEAAIPEAGADEAEIAAEPVAVAEEGGLPEEAGLGEPAADEAAPASFADTFEEETTSAEAAPVAEPETSPGGVEEPPAFAVADEALPAGEDMLPAEEATPAVDEDFFTAEASEPEPAAGDEMAGLSAAEEASLSAPPEAEIPPVAEPQFEAVDDELPVAEAGPVSDEPEPPQAFEAELPPATPVPSTVELSLEERARAASPYPTEEAAAFDEAEGGEEGPAIGFDALDEGETELPSEVPGSDALADELETEAAYEPPPAAASADAAGSFADVVPSEPEPPPSEAAQVAVPADMVAQIAQRVVAQISDKVIREVAWEVVPDLAEALIKKEIERLREELNKL